jgi:hypothetical protein
LGPEELTGIDSTFQITEEAKNQLKGKEYLFGQSKEKIWCLWVITNQGVTEEALGRISTSYLDG